MDYSLRSAPVPPGRSICPIRFRAIAFLPRTGSGRHAQDELQVYRRQLCSLDHAVNEAYVSMWSPANNSSASRPVVTNVYRNSSSWCLIPGVSVPTALTVAENDILDLPLTMTTGGRDEAGFPPSIARPK